MGQQTARDIDNVICVREPELSENRAEESNLVYYNSIMIRVIEEVIHSERDRNILKRRLIDNITISDLAEEFDLSVRQMQRIITKGEYIVFKHYEEFKE